MAHGVFGADSSFGVGLRAAGGVGVTGFRLVFVGLSFWRGGAGGWATILCGLDT